MQFEKQLPGDRSPLMLAMRGDARIITQRYAAAEAGTTFVGRSTASGSRVRSYPNRRAPAKDWLISDDRTLRTSSGEDAWWRAISAAVIGLTAKAIGRFATFGDVAFSGFLLAVLSWTFSQALAGCAAYAEAMYPNFGDLDEHRDRHVPNCE
jgi:hypothetical protein